MIVDTLVIALYTHAIGDDQDWHHREHFLVNRRDQIAMPDHVRTVWWIALFAGWVVSASVFAWMQVRARRLDRSARDPAFKEMARRTAEIFIFLLGLCVGCEFVLLVSGAPRAVSAFWLLASAPVAYAGMWVTMGVMACLSFRGWRPRPRPRS